MASRSGARRRLFPVSVGQRAKKATKPGECRKCQSFCDKLVDPAACIALGCRYLYSYEDQISGGRFMGCMQKVFATEIDVELFRDAERTRAGFGAVRLANPPLARCHFSVERAHEGGGEAHECVNRRFFDTSDEGAEGIRAFDLRHALT